MNAYSHTVVDFLYQAMLSNGLTAAAQDFLTRFLAQGYWHTTGGPANALCSFLASMLGQEDSDLRLCLCPQTPATDLVNEILEVVIPTLVSRGVLGAQNGQS